MVRFIRASLVVSLLTINATQAIAEGNFNRAEYFRFVRGAVNGEIDSQAVEVNLNSIDRSAADLNESDAAVVESTNADLRALQNLKAEVSAETALQKLFELKTDQSIASAELINSKVIIDQVKASEGSEISAGQKAPVASKLSKAEKKKAARLAKAKKKAALKKKLAKNARKSGARARK